MTSAEHDGEETAATTDMTARQPALIAVRSTILGEIEVPTERGLAAVEAIAGFPGALHYAILPHVRSDDTVDERVAWLQSLEPPFHALPVARREHAPRGYDPEVPASDLVRLDLRSAEDARFWLILTVPPDGAPTINLRAPLVVNEGGRLMKQVILPDDRYPTRSPLLT